MEKVFQYFKLGLIFCDLSQHNIIQQFLQSSLLLFHLHHNPVRKSFHIHIQSLLALFNLLNTKISYFFKMCCKLHNRNGLMVNPLKFMLVIQSSEAVATDHAVELTLFVISN